MHAQAVVEKKKAGGLLLLGSNHGQTRSSWKVMPVMPVTLSSCIQVQVARMSLFKSRISFLVLGGLQCHSPVIVCDICLRQQQLFVQVGLVLLLVLLGF